MEVALGEKCLVLKACVRKKERSPMLLTQINIKEEKSKPRTSRKEENIFSIKTEYSTILKYQDLHCHQVFLKNAS